MIEPKALAQAKIDPDDLGPKMRACSPQEQLFIWAYVNGKQGRGAQQHAAREAGYSASSNAALYRAANKLMNRPRVVAAIMEQSQIGLRKLAPLAVHELRAIAVDRKHPDQLKALRTILDRTDAAVHAASVDLRVTDQRQEREDLTLQLLRELKGAGASRDVLQHFFGYSGLSVYEAKLAKLEGAAEGAVIEGEVVEVTEQSE